MKWNKWSAILGLVLTIERNFLTALCFFVSEVKKCSILFPKMVAFLFLYEIKAFWIKDELM